MTTPVRTIIDLTRTSGRTETTFAFIEACRLGLIRRGHLAGCVERSLGLPGAREVRRLVGQWIPELERTRSALEGLYLILWAAYDPRLPGVNVKWREWEVDFLWRDEMVAVEVDGGAFHRDEVTKRRDRAKQAELESAGYTVLRFGYEDVTECGAEVMATTRLYLEAAG